MWTEMDGNGYTWKDKDGHKLSVSIHCTALVLSSYRPDFEFFDRSCPILSATTAPLRLSPDEEQGVAVMLQIWGQSVQASSNAPL